MQFSSVFLLTALAALSAATPLVARDGSSGSGSGGSNNNNNNNNASCGNNNTIACCQNKPDGGKGGINAGSALAGALQCSPITAQALDLIPIYGVNSASVCPNYVACCSGNNEQNGLINVNAPCFAL